MPDRPSLLFPLLLLPALACGDRPVEDSAEPAGVCDPIAGEAPELEVRHYAEFTEPVATVYCGIPPQGGAPYAPFGIRVHGIDPFEGNAMTVTITATDTTTDEVVGTGEFTNLFLCSNIGENEGWWLLNEVHLRFAGHTTDDLHGRTVAFEFAAEGLTETVTDTLTVPMDCIAGD